MSDSFAEQLSNVKLKPSKNKTKDFSDPKLAGEFEVNTYLISMIKVGFITKDQISAYQKTALEANMEEWQMLLADETFPTSYLLSNNIFGC
ncbi:unnamed protein product [Rotaria magnacalcarata]|uniref:Uncharacterized protein n=1 Tax=Rotaria magnacalcarata TaxID=392030 RepID=A0A8S3FCI4_9BILA|nr:unnamed protein product [Rotaria magnacalcarata]